MLTDQDIAKDLRVMQSGLIDQAYRDVFLKMPQYVRALQQTRQDLREMVNRISLIDGLIDFDARSLGLADLDALAITLQTKYGWTEGGDDE